MPAPPPSSQPVPSRSIPSSPALLSSINFLREKRRVLTTTMQKDRVIARYTGAGVAAFFVVFLVVVIAHFFLIRQQKTVEDKTAALGNEIRSMAAFEREYVIFVRKVKLLYAFDQKRKLKQKTTNFFYGFVPKEDTLIEAKIDEQQGQIVFQIETPDVFRVLELLKAMYSDAVTQQGYVMKATAADRKPTGKYIVTGTLSFASFY